MQPKRTWNVSRERPGCYVFLLDQSNSMDDCIGGSTQPKKKVLADAVNYYLNVLISQCEKKKGDPPWQYYDLALIGYSTDEHGNPEIGSVLACPPDQDELLRPEIVSIVELNQTPLGSTEVNGEPILYWYEPAAKHGTPMAAGLNYCRQLAEGWASVNYRSVPPIVVHITDGEPSDQSDPEAAARALRSVHTEVGNTLLFNIHLSSEDAPATLLPSSEAELPNEYARMLFRMSSELPDFCVTMAQQNNLTVAPGARGMAFNTDATALLTLLNIGTLKDERARLR